MQDAIDNLAMFAVGSLVGAGLMYLMDPGMGRGRRQNIREKMIKGINLGRQEADRFVRDKRNRAKGLIYEMRRGGSRAARKASGVAENVGQAVRG
jgi:hypothetical protein